jgi:hypothetical protein
MMKTIVTLLFVLVTTAFPPSAYSQPHAPTAPVTNLVEILPYVQDFSKKLDLEIPLPLTTNAVTSFRRGQFGAGIRVLDRWHFSFEAKGSFINTYYDRRYAMHVLWRAEDIKPLIQPSKITKEQALEIARKYLERLGYSEKKMPVLPPTVNQWTWDPAGAPKSESLPFFTIKWPWSKYPDWEYFEMEIDGFRKKVTQFSTIYPRQDPPQRAEKE